MFLVITFINLVFKVINCRLLLIFVEYMNTEIFSSDLWFEYGFKLGTVTHHFWCSLGLRSNLYLLHGEAVINVCHIEQTLARQVAEKL